MPKTFLTAEWRKLLMANYVVDPELLAPFVPFGTTLDLWQGRCYVSLVGFMFLRTKVMGISIPFHRDFEEVNLRFYVRRGDKRGVVFIKEIVPKPAISWVANAVYRENYATCRMRHHWHVGPDKLDISYSWKPFWGGEWYQLSATTEARAQVMAEGSEAEFITEHYWGYARAGAQRTNEYEVSHPRWEVYPVQSYAISGDFGRLYGPQFEPALRQTPVSVFVAEGSEVSVMRKSTIV